MSSTNRLFELARMGQRLPHIALAIPLSFAFIFTGLIVLGIPVSLLWEVVFPNGLAALADHPFDYGVVSMVALVANFGLIYGVLWVWLTVFEKRPFWTLGLEWTTRAILKYGRGVLVGVLMFVAVLGGCALFGYIAPETTHVEREGPLALGGVLIIFLGWMVQGGGEEVLARGWLMGVIGARYRPWLGVLVSAIVFAVMHGLNPNIAPLPLINLFLFGIFAALYALWEGGLWGIAAWHAAWNWTQGNLFGMQVSGGSDTGPILFNLQEAGPDLITGGAFGPEGGLAVTLLLLVSIAVLAWLLRRKQTMSALNQS